MEDSVHWRAVGCIEAGQPITDVAVFFGVHHSGISHLWKQFQTTLNTDSCPKARSLSPKGYNPPEDRYIAILTKQNHRATSIRVTPMVTAFIDKTISAATVS